MRKGDGAGAGEGEGEGAGERLDGLAGRTGGRAGAGAGEGEGVGGFDAGDPKESLNIPRGSASKFCLFWTNVKTASAACIADERERVRKWKKP